MANVTNIPMQDLRGVHRKAMQDWAALFDPYNREIVNRLPEFADAFLKRESTVRENLSTLFASVESTILRDPNDRASIVRAARRVRETFVTALDETAVKVEKDVDAEINSRMGPKRVTDAVQAARQREIRDLLRNEDPVRLEARVKTAAVDGVESEVLDAISDSPLPMVRAELIAEARRAIVLRDRPVLTEKLELARAYRFLYSNALQIVDGVAPEVMTEETTPPEPQKAFLVGTRQEVTL